MLDVAARLATLVVAQKPGLVRRRIAAKLPDRMTGCDNEVFISDAQTSPPAGGRECTGRSAAHLPPIPRYEVHRARTALVIDGKLDDTAWRSAGEIEFRFPWEQQTGAKQKTTARLLWNDEYLYPGLRMRGSDIVAHLYATRRPYL